MSNPRDDFSEKTAVGLAKRAAYRCSNPDCRAFTIIPSTSDPKDAVYTGVAAHITAAAKGGPRYDGMLTPQQRSGPANGIHLCGTCSIMIDKNGGKDFPTGLLIAWKNDHDAWVGEQNKRDPEALLLYLADKAIFSYARDMATLRAETGRVLRSLEPYGKIELADGTVRIDRECLGPILSAAATGDLLIVGAPGSGKSGVFTAAASILRDAGADTVVFAADQLGANSPGLLRAELNLNHDLVEVLANWSGKESGYVFVDALDAARDEPAADTLRELLAAIIRRDDLKRWTVVASIRKYDLRYSSRLAKLFVGDAVVEYCDPEFARVRHADVGLLTDGEMAQAAAMSKGVKALLSSSSEKLRELLRNPFNLRLASELLADGVPAEGFAAVVTQIELLSRYWQERVVRNDGKGASREAIAEGAARRMAGERSLVVERRDVLGGDAAAGEHLEDLLHRHVMVEWQRTAESRVERDMVRFSHHVLFDYAVARTFRGKPATLVARLAEDPGLVVAARPSIAMHFSYLWHQDCDREAFWEAVLALVADKRVPAVGRLIGASLAESLADRAEDFAPLLRALRGPGIEAAAETLGHLQMAAIASDRPLIGHEAAPWPALIDAATASDQPEVSRVVVALLMGLCDRAPELSPDGLASCGRAARRLLASAWGAVPVNEWLAANAIEAVCKAVASDPEETAAALEPAIRREHLASFGYRESFRIASNVSVLIAHVPRFVEDLYAAIFSFEDESDEKTAMGTPVVPMSSTRKQDYGIARYELGEKFSRFLDAAPIYAMNAFVRIAEARSDPSEPDGPEARIVRAFSFDGSPAAISGSHTRRWHYEDPLGSDAFATMEAALTERLSVLSDSECDSALRRAILAAAVARNTAGSVWRLLLACAATHPATLGLDMAPALEAAPLLFAPDTHYAASDLLASVFVLLPTEARERIEAAIMAVPAADDEEGRGRDTLIQMRENLLSRIDPQYAVGEATKEAISELALKDGGTEGENSEPATYLTPHEDETDSEDVAPRPGHNPDPIVDYLEALGKFRSQWETSAPPMEAVGDIGPTVDSLFALLSAGQVADDQLAESARGVLARACEAAARCKGLDFSAGIGGAIRASLLYAAKGSEPLFSERQDAQFAVRPGWSVPSSRIDAGAGLMTVIRGRSEPDQGAVDAVLRLAADPVAAVRYQISLRLHYLYEHSSEVMWSLIEGFVAVETNASVLSGLLNGVRPVYYREPERVTTFLRVLLGKHGSGSVLEIPRGFIAAMLGDSYIWKGNAEAGEAVRALINDVAYHANEIQTIVFQSRKALSSEDGAIRSRSVGYVFDAATAAIRDLRRFEETYDGVSFNDVPSDDASKIESLTELVNRIGSEIYFASGAYSEARGNRTADDEPMSEGQRTAFLRELSPAIRSVAATGNPRTVYNFLLMLEHYIPVDPPGVFVLVAEVITTGVAGRPLQFDSMGVDVAARIATRYIAEFPTLLKEAVYQAMLVSILDVFVSAGSPVAAKVAYRLSDLAN